MRHLQHEQLAGIALGEPDSLSKRDRAHLRICRQCSDELADLRRIVTTAREAKPYDLRPPRPAVLAQIQSELKTDPASRTETPAAPIRSQTSRVLPAVGSPAARHPRRSIVAAVAAVALVAVSAGGVVWYRQVDKNDSLVVARATLQPLPDKAGQGAAELIRNTSGEVLSISVKAEGVEGGFEELWLINTDGKRMISLGVVPPDGRAVYPVPAKFNSALDGYTIVDISLEPFDGNAAHSRNSLLRGTLS